MLILAGTILAILAVCCLAAGLYEESQKNGEKPKKKKENPEG